MGIYSIAVTIVYALGVLGLGVATIALLFNGMKSHQDYREFARRLMAIAAGTIAGGVILIPVYRIIGNLAKGADPLSSRALILGGLIPAALGLAIGFGANKLLREKSARAIRLLILLCASFGTYMLVGIAAIYTVANHYKMVNKELGPNIQELRDASEKLETSIAGIEPVVLDLTSSLIRTEALSETLQKNLDSIGAKLRQPSQVGQYAPSYLASSLLDVGREMDDAATTLRKVMESQGPSITCKASYTPCLAALLDETSKAATRPLQRTLEL